MKLPVGVVTYGTVGGVGRSLETPMVCGIVVSVRELPSYDRENHVSGHFEYAFLLDECVMHLVTLFPKGRAKTIADFRKRGAADSHVVALAHADGRIIVTNNSRDYRSEMKTFAKRWGNDKCSDLSGLLILPNDVLDQQRVLDLPKLERRIKRRWIDVARDNLLIQVDRDGKVTVDQLPRCGFCERLAVSSS